MSKMVYQLRNVTRCYDDRCVLQIEHLDIRAGEILAVVGPSGAGKSTLLRLLNFLEPPTTGEIRFLGQAAFEREGDMPLRLRRRVTTVFQRPMLLNRSVWANAAFGLRLRGQRDAHQFIEATLKKVGLGERNHQSARTLSGGEAQRVALARAMILRPDVLLLDEPTANLDPYNVGLIEDIVRRLNAEQSTTLVMVTHNVFQARRLAHRVGLLLNGEFVEISDTKTFFESPHDPRTSAFVEGEIVY